MWSKGTLAVVFLQLCLFFSSSLAATVIGHDKVVSLPRKISSGVTGKLYLKYQPYLKVEQGCVPFPAVDSRGRVGGGLKPTGAINGKCGKSKGQVYVRSMKMNGRFGIMYAWYFPKDQVAAGPAGHRHDWEATVVWLDKQASNAKLLAICPSRHGKFYCTRSNLGRYTSNSHPKILYRPDGTHSLFVTTTKGGQQAAVDWYLLPSAARNALNTHSWGGDAIIPINNAKFESHMKKAKYW